MTDESSQPEAEPAEIVREYGPIGAAVHGVTFDGQHVWCATGRELLALDPESGTVTRTLAAAADAGTAFDGAHFYQIAGASIHKLDPTSGRVLASIPAPAGSDNAGLAWADGSLWLGRYRAREILQIDPQTGAVLRTLASNRFVTGVSWVDGELWHGTWEDDQSELRQLDAESGAVRTRLALPKGVFVSGVESDGAELFYCGGGPSGRVRAVKRPRKAGG